MERNARRALEDLRADFNSQEEKEQAEEAFEARMKLIAEKAGGALEIAMQGDLLQIEEVERIREQNSTAPYQFNYYVRSSDSDEELGFDDTVVVTKTVSIRLAANPENPKTGDELVLYFPVPDDFMLEATTTFAELGPIHEFFALKKVKNPSGDYDAYMHFSPKGVRSVPQPSRKIKDQIGDFRRFIATADVSDFAQLDYTRNDVEAMRRDLLNMQLVWHKRSSV